MQFPKPILSESTPGFCTNKLYKIILVHSYRFFLPSWISHTYIKLNPAKSQDYKSNLDWCFRQWQVQYQKEEAGLCWRERSFPWLLRNSFHELLIMKQRRLRGRWKLQVGDSYESSRFPQNLKVKDVANLKNLKVDKIQAMWKPLTSDLNFRQTTRKKNTPDWSSDKPLDLNWIKLWI